MKKETNFVVHEITTGSPVMTPGMNKIWEDLLHVGSPPMNQYPIPPDQDYLEPGGWSGYPKAHCMIDRRGRKVVVIPIKAYFAERIEPELRDGDYHGSDSIGKFQNLEVIVHQRYTGGDLWVLSRPQQIVFENGYAPNVELIKELLAGEFIRETNRHSHYKLYVLA